MTQGQKIEIDSECEVLQIHEDHPKVLAIKEYKATSEKLVYNLVLTDA